MSYFQLLQVQDGCACVCDRITKRGEAAMPSLWISTRRHFIGESEKVRFSKTNFTQRSQKNLLGCLFSFKNLIYREHK